MNNLSPPMSTQPPPEQPSNMLTAGQPAAGMQPQPMGNNPLTPQAPQQPPPSPTQIQDAHEHFSTIQKMLYDLMKLPDSELTTKHLLGAASDVVTMHRLSKGKKGLSAIEIASQLTAPDFPKPDADPEQIRQFLQKHFDQNVMWQAAVSHKFGAPVQQPSAPNLQ